jgi:hypothetical protein
VSDYPVLRHIEPTTAPYYVAHIPCALYERAVLPGEIDEDPSGYVESLTITIDVDREIERLRVDRISAPGVVEHCPGNCPFWAEPPR